VAGQEDGSGPEPSKQQRIMAATLRILARDGFTGLSVRSVAAEAGLAPGLLTYYHPSKTELVAAALRQIGEQDDALVAVDEALDPVARVRAALHRAVSPEVLTPDYLALRLQLWALGQADAEFSAINRATQRRYRNALAKLVAAARPELPMAEVRRRATDVSMVQSGVWLTALLGVDRGAVKRSIVLCEAIALDGHRGPAVSLDDRPNSR
jgi:TetR/AcrR family transcriptional regulator, cholesterol catabolism regulator